MWSLRPLLRTALLLLGWCAWLGHEGVLGQGALGDLDLDVMVPPGGVLDNGAPAGWPVQSGDLLLSLVQSPTSMFATLVDDEANLTWAAQTPYRGFYMKPWGPGEFVWYNYTLRKWTVVDAAFNPLDTLTQTFVPDDDYHDVHRFEDGTYLVVLLEEVFEDLTSIGGLSNAKILNPRLLHLDPQEQILQEWSGLDHMPVDPSVDNLDFEVVDHLHWNAVQLDEHGGVLLSIRNRNQIVRLRPDDWSIHWKLGGEDSDFSLNDPGWDGFHLQHDVHDVGNGRILMFDNGVLDNNGFLSRALELALDTVNFTAQNAWQFAHPSDIYAAAQGSAIRLENGNTLIGWGTAETSEFGTRVTEVTPQGHIAFEVRLTDGSTLYRARKYATGMLSGCTAESAVNVSNSPWLLDADDCTFDLDEDRWTDEDGDCDDADAAVYPGANDIPLDGIDQDCDGVDAVPGCTDAAATNFDSEASVNDGSCTYLTLFKVDISNEEGGGWDVLACGLEWTSVSDAGFENASTVMPTNAAWETAQFSLALGLGLHAYRFVRPDGIAEVDARTLTIEGGASLVDAGVVCFNEEFGCPGCTDPMDAAYNPWAVTDDGCEGWSVAGCTYPEATNYSTDANDEDGTCIFEQGSPCTGDLDGDGSVSVGDLMEMLVAMGSTCD